MRKPKLTFKKTALSEPQVSKTIKGNIVLMFLSGFVSFYSVSKPSNIAFRKANLITGTAIQAQSTTQTWDGKPVARCYATNAQKPHRISCYVAFVLLELVTIIPNIIVVF